MVGESVHHDGESEDVAGCRKEEKDQLGDPEDLATPRAEHDICGIGHAVNRGVALSELADNVAGVGGDDPETDDQNDATGGVSGGHEHGRIRSINIRDEADGCQGCRDGQDAQGNGFSNHHWCVLAHIFCGRRIRVVRIPLCLYHCQSSPCVSLSG